MRIFLVFAICMAVSSAAPYSGFASSSAGAEAHAGAGGFLGVLPGAVSLGTGSYSQAGATAIANSGAFATAGANTRVITNPTVIEKSFFYHIAQEDATAKAATNTLTITPRKHYKVIFIKAPTASANAEARARAASQIHEKTIVYVLVNKPAEAMVDANAEASTFNSGKPEVYFIKYGAGATASAVSTSNAGVGVGLGGYHHGIAGTGAHAAANAVGLAGSGGVGVGAGATASATSGVFNESLGGFNNAGASAEAANFFSG